MPVAPNAPTSQSHAKNQAIYRDVVQGAANGGAVLMGKLVSAARLALQTREAASRDLRERDSLAESAKLLRMHEGALCKRYPQDLLDAFANPEGVKKATTVSIENLHFDQLELMDETTVLTSVALARTQQIATMASEASLSDLNALICTLLGLGAVRPESNPLRPEIYIKALKVTIESTQAPAGTQLDWVGSMSGTLGQELRSLYVALCKRLRADGVVAASFAMAQAPMPSGIGRGVAQQVGPAEGAPVPVQAAPPVAYAAVPASVAHGNVQSARVSAVQAQVPVPVQRSPVRSRDDVLLTLDKLRRLLSGELDSQQPANSMERFAAQFAYQFESGPAPVEREPQTDFDATVPAALEALTEMRQVDRVVQSLEQRRNAPVPSQSMPVNAIRQELRSNVRDIAQALSLEVVTLMVDNMARDPRLLAPVQQLIRDLEPALLRLALVDPRFFTDKHHCARRVLQDITHSSLAFNAVKAPGFDIYLRELSDAVGPLLNAPIADAEPFERLLAVLQEARARNERQKEKERESTVEILKHAEARNLLAEKIARGIEGHLDSKQVPAVVIDFLCGPWAQVVAQARIKGGSGSVAADKYQALIAALLWSAHPELARQSVSKLTRLVPKLLSTLREGLDTIQYPVTKTSAFLEALMAIHQVAFRATPDAPAAANPLPARAEGVRVVEDGNPWIAPQEAQSSNLMELSELPEESVPPAPPSSDQSELTSEPLDVDADLPIGAWVELHSNGQWVRTQLTWASPHGTLFLFTSAYGTTQSMTRRSRDKLVQAGKLRLVSSQAVVEVALDAVAQVAMRNSVDTTY